MPLLTAKLKYILLTVVFVLGYTSLSFELIILRQLINFVGSNTLITSVVITFILLFLSVGYYIGSTLKMSLYPIRNIILKFLKILAIWYIFACTYHMIKLYFLLMYWLDIRSSLAFVSIFSAVFLAFPSLALGFITSFIGRIVHRHHFDYTGRFMAVDTLGSVCGSLATTLFFMPLIGVGATIVILVLLTCVTIWLLERRREMVLSTFLNLLCLALAITLNSRYIINEAHINMVKDDAISRIELIEQDFKNNKPQSLLMTINGSASSKISTDENLMFEYVKFINNTFIAPLLTTSGKDILILGAGGFTIGLNDKVNNYTFLDIDKDLQKISEELFLRQPLSDNKKFIAQDAYLFMINSQQLYDLIVVDVFSSKYSIPMNFVTTDFFEMVKKHLKPEGIMVVNTITSPAFNNSFSKRLDNTLRKVFPQYLSRQTLQPYNPYEKEALVNVEYIYYNHTADSGIYTLNKNTAVYGQ